MFDFQQISRYRKTQPPGGQAGHRRVAQEHLGDLFRLCQHLRRCHPAGGGGAARPPSVVQGCWSPGSWWTSLPPCSRTRGWSAPTCSPRRHPGSPRRRRGYRGHHGAPGGAGPAPGLHRRRPGPRLLPPQRRRGLPLYPGGASTPCWAAAPRAAPRPPSGRGPVRFAPARPAGYGSTPPARSRKGRCPAFGRERNALQGADRVS